MDLTHAFLPLLDNADYKKLVLIGSHDDGGAAALAPHFKTVDLASERLKIEAYTAGGETGNLNVAATAMGEVLNELHRYDVVAFEHTFHLLADVMQREFVNRLGRYQELIVMESDLTGTWEHFYSAFADERYAVVQSRALRNRMLSDGQIELDSALKGRNTDVFAGRQVLIDHMRYLLPEHYAFGERDFLRKTGGLLYPLELWNGFDVFKFVKSRA